jgi:DNA polymerase II large subunit
MKNALILLLIFVVVVGVGAWFIFANQTPAEPTESTESMPSEATATNTTETTDSMSGDTNQAEDYIGLTVAEAEALATANDEPFRVVERDGEMLPTTRDYRPGRINATVEDGTVVAYEVEGAEAEGQGVGEGDPDANRDDFGEPTTPSPDTEEGQHDEILGMTVAEAEAYAEAKEVPFRVGTVDGEPRGLTMDYRPGRITADVKDGVVTDYSVE